MKKNYDVIAGTQNSGVKYETIKKRKKLKKLWHPEFRSGVGFEIGESLLPPLIKPSNVNNTNNSNNNNNIINPSLGI